MDCEIVAIGTELLLGQIVDTNSAWMGEQLAAAGIGCRYQVKVGDNRARIVEAIRIALGRSDAVICCGGLGPTQDDITREAIAEVMGVPLVRDATLVAALERVMVSRGRTIAANNYRQGDRPEGAVAIEQRIGTAPGLICPVGARVVYAVPGVPAEMREMLERAVIPDLVTRAGERATIRSRNLRVFGIGESRIAEMVAGRVDALDAGGNPTIAFLASFSEGVRVRVTARASGPDAKEAATALLDEEEAQLRAILGDAVFGVDDDTLEDATARLLLRAGLTLGVAESLTGGLVAARLTSVAGASEWFRGALVPYDRRLKYRYLGVPEGPVVSEEAAAIMARGAAMALGADVGLSLTGVAGPEEQDGQPVGTVWVGLHLDERSDATLVPTAGARQRIRESAAGAAIDLLRRRLVRRGSAEPVDG